MGLKRELETLLNQHCRENKSNTPDFILAEYLIDALKAFETAVNKREKWSYTSLSKDLIKGARNERS